MQSAMELVALADDVSVIRAFEYLDLTLRKEMEKAAPGKLEETIQETSDAVESFGSLVGMLGEHQGHKLTDEQSVLNARQIFTDIILKHDGEDIVKFALQNWTDDQQSVGKILSVGCVGAVWIILATTKVSVKDNEIEIEKLPLMPERIELESKKLKTKLSVDIASVTQQCEAPKDDKQLGL